MHLHAEYKLQQYFFLKVWQKYYQISILGTLATSVRPLPSKTIILTCRNCDVCNKISACKKWTPYLTSFLRYCKDVTNVLYLEYFENAWSYPSIIIASPCRKLWCPNCWNKLVGNSHPYLHAKNHLHHSRFLMILLRNSKLVILSNLGMPGQKHMKWQYHFEGTFDVYLQAIINFIRHVFLETLQRYCKLVILDTLGMSGHTHSMILSTCRKLLCLSAGKKIRILCYVFLEILQIYANLLFWYFGHAWLCTHKMIVSTYRKLKYLSACLK